MLFNLFADPLDPKSNTIGIYADMGLASKLFVNQHTLGNKLKELKIRGINIEFDSIGGIRRPYNNLSAHALAIAYPEFCQKYWKDKGDNWENVLNNQAKMFDTIVKKINEARRIHEENQKKIS